MADRGMNNYEKQAAKKLKDAGFTVYWQDGHADGNVTGGHWWAKHPQLICAYHVATCWKGALIDLWDKQLQAKRETTLKTIKENKAKMLNDAWQYCDENDKSTEYMLQYMQDYAGVDLDEVLVFLQEQSDQAKTENPC